MKTIFMNILTFGTLFSSVLAITSKNPVISVIFVISTFVNAAGYLILLGVNFIGISYIVIYVGAIAVLFLFVIMMINIKLTDILETGSQYTKNLPLALAIGFLFIYIIYTLIPVQFGVVRNGDSFSFLLDYITSLNGLISTSNIQYINLMDYLAMDLSIADTLLTEFTQIEVLGHGLYTYGAVLLIVLSVILLLAMIATIIISRSEKKIIN